MTKAVHAGKEYPPFTVEVEAGDIAAFARCIGETNAIYFDREAAQKAGYRAQPAPPTMAHALPRHARPPVNAIEAMGFQMAQAIHGEQSFLYHRDICAGDTLTGRLKVTHMEEKKAGTLLLIRTETRLENQAGEHVLDLLATVFIRDLGAGFFPGKEA